MPLCCEHFFVFGVSHHRAPLRVRERLALSKEARDRFADDLRQHMGVREVLVLSTCNRLEIYGLSCDSRLRERLCEKLAAETRAGMKMLRECHFWLEQRAAVEHLFEVAAGIDSQMVGETEILGQVKQAYLAAAEAGYTGTLLNKVFQGAMQAGKWARTATGIGRGQVSTASVAVDLVKRVFGDLRQCRVLLLGAGAVARDCSRVFRERGCRHLAVAGRTVERAQEVARVVGAHSLELRGVAEMLFEFDIVIGSTSAPGYLLEKPEVEMAVGRRKGLPLFFLDLAVPRDFDPVIESMDGVFLFNLDDLASVANENLEERRLEIEGCRQGLVVRAAEIWQSVGEVLRRSPGGTCPKFSGTSASNTASAGR